MFTTGDAWLNADTRTIVRLRLAAEGIPKILPNQDFHGSFTVTLDALPVNDGFVVQLPSVCGVAATATPTP